MKRRNTQHPSPAAKDPGTAKNLGTAKKRRSRTDRAVARKFLTLIKSGADTRFQKVKRVRQAVRTRSYENELKLSIAMDRLARDLSA